MSTATAVSSSSLTAGQALKEAARRMEEFIDVARRRLDQAQGLARLAQDEALIDMYRANAAQLAESLIENARSHLGSHKEGQYLDPALPDELRRPWYYINRAIEIDLDTVPGRGEICEAGDYDAMPIGELARLVKTITAVRLAAENKAVVKP